MATVKITIDGVESTGKISDGYHTFDELYEHRCWLWLKLCSCLHERSNGHIWRSKVHSDGSAINGWFLLGSREVVGKQMSYHLPLAMWDATQDFAYTLDRAPAWDGHTSADVLVRLKAL